MAIKFTRDGQVICSNIDETASTDTFNRLPFKSDSTETVLCSKLTEDANATSVKSSVSNELSCKKIYAGDPTELIFVESPTVRYEEIIEACPNIFFKNNSEYNVRIYVKWEGNEEYELIETLEPGEEYWAREIQTHNNNFTFYAEEIDTGFNVRSIEMSDWVPTMELNSPTVTISSQQGPTAKTCTVTIKNNSKYAVDIFNGSTTLISSLASGASSSYTATGNVKGSANHSSEKTTLSYANLYAKSSNGGRSSSASYSHYINQYYYTNLREAVENFVPFLFVHEVSTGNFESLILNYNKLVDAVTAMGGIPNFIIPGLVIKHKHKHKTVGTQRQDNFIYRTTYRI